MINLQVIEQESRRAAIEIGEAAVICAGRRPGYIGGSRTVYDEKLM